MQRAVNHAMCMSDFIYLTLMGLAAVVFYLSGYYAGLRRTLLDPEEDSDAPPVESQDPVQMHFRSGNHLQALLPDPTGDLDLRGKFINN